MKFITKIFVCFCVLNCLIVGDGISATKNVSCLKKIGKDETNFLIPFKGWLNGNELKPGLINHDNDFDFMCLVVQNIFTTCSQTEIETLRNEFTYFEIPFEMGKKRYILSVDSFEALSTNHPENSDYDSTKPMPIYPYGTSFGLHTPNAICDIGQLPAPGSKPSS